MARSAESESEVIAMQPRDAWVLEKLGEMKARRKAAAFNRRFKSKSHEERSDRFKKNGLPIRIEFSRRSDGTKASEKLVQDILKQLRYEGPLSAGMLGWDLKVSPDLIDSVLARLAREKRVKTNDGIFWELGENLGIMEGCDGEPVKPELIVLCGPSHSGKSSFAHQLPGNFRIINSDWVRRKIKGNSSCSRHEPEVWEKFNSLKCKAMKEGHNVVLDACHLSKNARRHSVEGPCSGYRKGCVVFDLSFSTIRSRCLKTKRLSLKVVTAMWHKFRETKPTPEELRRLGFDYVVFVNKEVRPWSAK